MYDLFEIVYNALVRGLFFLNLIVMDDADLRCKLVNSVHHRQCKYLKGVRATFARLR